MNPDRYATDLTDEQWNILAPFVPAPKPRGRRRSVCRRRIIEAILYLLHTGCQWRMLPKDFPHWKTVSNLFYQRRNSGLWQRMHDALVVQVRRAEGRQPSPSAPVSCALGCGRAFGA